jgi:predicted nucleic acid-binding protein
MKAFLDTNGLVYRIDFKAPEKQQRAAELVDALYLTYLTQSAVISTQVLQALYNTLRQNPGVSPGDATVAAKRHVSGQFSFWNALIVKASLASGCKTLYSEDMQHGLVLDGMTIENPFLGL